MTGTFSRVMRAPWRSSTLVALGFCAAASVLASGCAQPPLKARDADPGVPNFTVATFNILDEQASDPSTVRAIGETGADVIALQEVTDVAIPAIRDKYWQTYPYMIFHPSGSAGIGMISKFPMVEREFLQAPNGWHPSLHVTVSSPMGDIEVLNLHLHAPDGKFIKSLQSFAALSSDHVNEMNIFWSQCTKAPTLVLGDFNEDDGGAAVKWLEDRGFTNILPLYHPGQFTWQGKSLGGQFSQALDHVMYTGEFVPLNAWVGDHGVSDHIPVMAHFEAAAH